MKKIISFIVIMLFFSSLFTFQSSADLITSKKVIRTPIPQGKIIGTVKEAATCIPNPLPGATVVAIEKGFLFSFESRYMDITDENGEFSFNVTPGTYRVFAFKTGYHQIQPDFWHTATVESGQLVNCSFILRSWPFIQQIATGKRKIDLLNTVSLL